MIEVFDEILNLRTGNAWLDLSAKIVSHQLFLNSRVKSVHLKRNF
jgi:hypothetical protein